MSDRITRYLREEWIHILIPAAVLLLTLLAVFLARRMFFALLGRMAARSSNRAIPIVISTLHGPIMIWGLILGLHLAAESSQMPERWLHYSTRAFLVLWILSLTIMASRLAGNLVKYFGGHLSSEMPATSLTRSLAQIFVSMIGGLILLNQLGISITPLLTALGVGGLAVALALQDTLSNLFAGFYISIAGQIRLADYIQSQLWRRRLCRGYQLAQHHHPDAREQHDHCSQLEARASDCHQLQSAGKDSGGARDDRRKLCGRSRPGGSVVDG